jgi:hypothetical protein
MLEAILQMPFDIRSGFDFRFNLSFRDVEKLLAPRGVEVSYKKIRCWTIRFGPLIAATGELYLKVPPDTIGKGPSAAYTRKMRVWYLAEYRKSGACLRRAVF